MHGTVYRLRQPDDSLMKLTNKTGVSTQDRSASEEPQNTADIINFHLFDS